MAPEQAELKPVSACTDIYALGLLLYEMITGAAAFDGDTPVAVAIKQIREYPKRPREIVPHISRAIDAVIMKCLQKDPTKRYQSVTDFEIALVKAAKARRASPWKRPSTARWTAPKSKFAATCPAALKKRSFCIERKDWRSLTQIQNDPVAMLGVTGIAAALAVFLLFGAWKSRTTNAQIVPGHEPQIRRPKCCTAQSCSWFQNDSWHRFQPCQLVRMT